MVANSWANTGEVVLCKATASAYQVVQSTRTRDVHKMCNVNPNGLQ